MKLSKYNYDLTVNIEKDSLSYEGFAFRRNYVFHEFTIHTPCLVKFRTRKLKGFITKITPKMVYIDIPDLETSKKCTIEQFVDANFTLDNYVRIEIQNEGIYRSQAVPFEIKQIFAQHKREVQNETRHNQPTPEQSFGLDFCRNLLDYKFAFSSYEALFNWFTLNEMQTFIKHGAKIVYVQELRDFTDARYSSEQIAYEHRSNLVFKPKIIEYSPRY